MTPPESPKSINKVSGSDMTSGSETTGSSMDLQSSEPSGNTVQDLSFLNSTENMDTIAAPNISNDDPASENLSGDTPQPEAIPPPSEYSDNTTSTTPVTTDTSTPPVTTDTSTPPVKTDTSTTPVTTDTSATPVTTDTSATPVTTNTSATPVITETPTPIATTSNVHSNTGKITLKENTDADDDVLPPTLFSTMSPKPPTRLPRKPRSLSKVLRRNINQGNLDTFVVRDSSMKRKPSGDAIVSPTSDHVAKAIRSDSGEAVS